MKSKLIFRLMGALTSALIIVSVFIPFISVTGYSQSLWQAHSSVGTLYLPIMIIVFGAIGVLVFATNFKTELAYATAGGLIFFLIMQTIPIIDQRTFNTLGVGYYCLVVGTILTGVMSFLCNLRTKKKVVETKVEEPAKEISMLDQIDKLYNDQSTVSPIEETNNLNNIIQPLTIQSNIESGINPIPTQNNINPIPIDTSVVNNPEPVQAENNIPLVMENNTLDQPTVNSIQEPVSNQNLSNAPIQTISESITETNINPVVSEFNIPEQNISVEQPVTSDFNQPTTSTQVSITPADSNPVTSEFNVQDAIMNSNPVTAEFNAQDATMNSNPVTSEFSIPTNSAFVSQSNSPTTEINQQQVVAQSEPVVIEPIQPLANQNKVDLMGEPTNDNNNSTLDIFG